MGEASTHLRRAAPVSPPSVLLLLGLGTLTLLFNMIVAARRAGGIDFGPASTVVPRGAALLAVVSAINYLDGGFLLAGPVWLFGLEYRQARVLIQVNGGMNLFRKIRIAANRL